MKLATWNVNSLKARMPRVLDLLEVHQRSSSAGYQVAHHSGGRWAGVALAARAELTDVCVGLAGEPSREEARWLEATVDGVRAVSVYVPNGCAPDTPTYYDKLRFYEAMADRIQTLSRDPLVVAGDLNVCPTDLDVYDPAAFVGDTHVTEAERERFRDLHPGDPGFTWWDYRAGHFHRKLGLRIDFFLMSQADPGTARRVRHRPGLPQGGEALGSRAAAGAAKRVVAPAASTSAAAAVRPRACAGRPRAPRAAASVG